MLSPVDYYSTKLQHRYDSAKKYSSMCGVKFKSRVEDIKGVMGNYLGSGAFATCYQLSGDKEVVIKQYSVHTNDAYPDYLEWVLERQDCKFVPKIFKVQEIGDTKLVWMQRYKPCKYESVAKDINKTFGQTQGWYGEGDLNIERMRKYGDDFVEFLKEMKEAFKDFNWDLHTGNILMADDGTPIITDPIVSRKTNRVYNIDVDFKFRADPVKEFKFPTIRRAEGTHLKRLKQLMGYKSLMDIGGDLFKINNRQWRFGKQVEVQTHKVERFKFKQLQIPKAKVDQIITPVHRRNDVWKGRNIRFA